MQMGKNEMVYQAGKASDDTRKVQINKIQILCIILIMAIMAVVAFLSWAWFANNKTVTADEFKVNASEQLGFELVTEGEEINSELKAEYLDESILCWKLSQESNLMNFGDQVGIAPGSAGSLTFYVIPHVDGALSIDCTLDIRPVLKGETDTIITETTAKLLRGHLLFICKYTCQDIEKQTIVDVRDGTFRIELPDGTMANQKQKITLDWFWPYTINDANHHDTFGNEISAMTQNQEYSEYFFYDSTGSVNVESGLKILNHHYNEADQLIGDNVKAVVLELTADLSLK